VRSARSRVDLIIALVALAVTVATAVYVGLESRCQRHLNESAANESAATAALVDAIFLADELDEQLTAYATYLTVMERINQRRAVERCGW
jgi:hypothetical protein